MTPFQQLPAFADVIRTFAYRVKQSPNINSVQITQAGGSVTGSITIKPQQHFLVSAIKVWTNYDNVGGVAATADSDAILARTFVPNNFTVKLRRDKYNNYSNNPIPQALLCSSGYLAGKVFPQPILYQARSIIQFNFQDTTGLFLLDALSEGAAVPLTIKLDVDGFDIPLDCWDKAVRLYPELNAIYGRDGGIFS